MSMVILDVLDVLGSAPPDDPPWGLRLCEQTGYGTGTVYPALDKLLPGGLDHGLVGRPPARGPA